MHLMQVSERCVIHEGDNRKVAPVAVADRVNLGLIPTSAESWRTVRCVFAVALARLTTLVHSTGTVLSQSRRWGAACA